MSNVVGEAVIHVRADTTSTGAAVSEEGAKAGKGYASGFVQNLKGIAAGIIGVLAVEKIKSFLTDSVAEARESQKVGAATTAIIKATGGAANVTAGQMGQLTTSISNKIGVDDEAIQSAANLVLAFKNVRNEAGKGNDVFNQTVKAGQDLAAAGFGSATSASKLLAKALNDPTKGISSLTRVLGPATDAQKAHVKALVDSGHTLEAQKFILKQVQDRVGGLAEATATNGEKSKVAWDNLKEAIGNRLLPVIDKVEGVFVRHIVPALQSTLKGTSLVGQGFHEFGVLAGAAFALIQQAARSVLPFLIAGFHQVLPVLVKLGQTLGKDVLQSVRNLLPVLTPLVKEAAQLASSFRSGELHIVATVLTGVGAALVSVTGFLGKHDSATRALLITIGIAIGLWKAFTVAMAVQKAVLAASTAVQAAYATAMLGSNAAVEAGGLTAVIYVARLIAMKVAQVATAAASGVMTAAQWLLNAALDANPIGIVVIALAALAVGLIYAYRHSQVFRDAISSIGEVITSVLGGAVAFIEKHWGLIVSLIGGPLGIVVVQVIKHFDTIKAVISAVIRGVVATVHQWVGFASGVINAIAGIVTFINGLPGKIKAIAGDMFNAGKSIIGRLLDGIKAIGTGAGGIADSVASAIKGVINGMIDRLNGLLQFSFNTHIPGVGTVSINPPDIGHLAGGTNNWRGGLSVVGERGPELAFLPRGTRVVPNNRAASALGGVIDYPALASALVAAGVDGRHITIAPQLPTGDPEAAAMAVFNRLAVAGVV